MRLLTFALAVMYALLSFGSDRPGCEDALPGASSSPAEITQSNYVLTPHHFALKTNLLYDAALMPNLEFEWLINNRWSVAVEGDVAWWKPQFDKVYRLAIISPEARYHFPAREPWRGFYAGAFAGIGKYQLERPGHQGHHGEGAMGGLSLGYLWPLGRHFLLEAGLGAGYLYTRYRVYENRDFHKLYLRTKTLHYFGPLKLKLAIAWRFSINTKSIKAGSTL